MRVIIVCGFLGSGKTTIIRELAGFMVTQKGFRVVILENEVGEVGIDDLFLASEGFQVRGIFGGCICCQLTGEVTRAVNAIGKEFAPDSIVIEATGIARPGSIVGILRDYGEGIESMVVVDVVDASRWLELTEITPDLILGQVIESDVVLVNKVDEQTVDAVDEIILGVRETNPDAYVHAVSAQDGLVTDLMEEITMAINLDVGGHSR